MECLLQQKTPAALFAAAIAAIALFIAKLVTKARGSDRNRLETAKQLARTKVEAIKRAIISKDLEKLGTIKGLVSEIHVLAEANRFPLHEILCSRERLDRWKYLAEEALANDGTVPIKRLLASMSNSPVNITNPQEPGTPGIEVNAQLALPTAPSFESEHWNVRLPGEAIIPPVPKDAVPQEAEKHPIERMIEDAMNEEDGIVAEPEAILPPQQKVIEVVTVEEDGTTSIAFEVDGEEPYIEIVLGPDDEDRPPDIAGPSPPPEAVLSVDEQVDKWFNTMVLPD